MPQSFSGMGFRSSLFRRTILATTFFVVPATIMGISPAMAQCAASAGSVAVPANGSTVTCYAGLTSTTQIGDGSTSATVNLEDNHLLDSSANSYGVYLDSATVTLGTSSRIDAGNTSIYTLGAGNVTLGTGAQLNAGSWGIFSNSGNSTINIGDNAQINSSYIYGAGIQQNGNPVITLGAGAQINSAGFGILNSFGGFNRRVTLTLGSGAQINASLAGVRSKYTDVVMQSGAQINAGLQGISLGYGNQNSTITLAPGSSITGTVGISGNNGIGSDTVDNAGTIQGTGGTAINLLSGNDALLLRTGSQIIGNVQAGLGIDILQLFGTGTEDANFQGFETFSMDGTDWALSGNSVLGTGNINSGILTNSGSMTVNMTVNNGATFANTGTQTGNVAVNAGGLFSGTGTSSGNVTNDGTVSPGAAGIGTLTFSGNYVQNAGGAFSAEIDSGGASDLLDVSGTANIAGSLSISQVGAGAIPDGAVYTLLQAGGGVAGSFSSVTDNLFFVDFTTTINPASVQITANRSLAASGNTATEIYLAEILDQAIAGGGAGTAAIDTLLNSVTSARQASDVLASQSCLVKSAAAHAAGAGMAQLAQVIFSHPARLSWQNGQETFPDPVPEHELQDIMADFPALPAGVFTPLNDIAPAAGEKAAWSPAFFWMQGTGTFGSVSGDSVARGNDYYGGGLVAGVEYQKGNDPKFGMYLSATRTISEVDGLRDEATTDTYLLGLYGSWQPSSRWDFKGLMSGGWMSYETARPTLAGTAVADFSGRGAYGYLETSYQAYKVRNSYASSYVSPLLGLESSALSNESYQETGAGAFNLSVNDSTTAQLKSSLGAQLVSAGKMPEQSFLGPLDVSAKFKTVWSHEFLDKYPRTGAEFAGAPSTDFENSGPRVDRDTFRFSGGLAASVPERNYMEFYTVYNLNLAQDASDNRLSGGFRLRW